MNSLLTTNLSSAYSSKLNGRGELEFVVQLPANLTLTQYSKVRLVYASAGREGVFVFADFCRAQWFGRRPRRLLGIWTAPSQPWVPLVTYLGSMTTFTLRTASGQPFDRIPDDFIITMEFA